MAIEDPTFKGHFVLKEACHTKKHRTEHRVNASKLEHGLKLGPFCWKEVLGYVKYVTAYVEGILRANCDNLLKV